MENRIVVSSDDLDYDEDGYVLYENEPFTGSEHWFYETGELGSELSYINGVQDGWTRGWYKSGQLKSETFYKNGVVKGIYKEWHESGQLKLETDVGENNLGEAVWKREWDETGNLIKEERYTQ